MRDEVTCSDDNHGCVNSCVSNSLKKTASNSERQREERHEAGDSGNEQTSEDSTFGNAGHLGPVM